MSRTARSTRTPLLKGRWRKAGIALAMLAALLTLCVIVLRALPHAPLSERIGSSRAVYARGGELLRLTLAPDEQYRVWVPLKDISPRWSKPCCCMKTAAFSATRE